MSNFELVQGDDLRIQVSVVDTFGDEVDINGATSIRWGIAQRFGSSPIFTKTFAAGEIVIPSDNVLYFDIDNTDSAGLSPGYYAHELEIVTATGQIYTPLQGRVRILPQILEAL